MRRRRTLFVDSDIVLSENFILRKFSSVSCAKLFGDRLLRKPTTGIFSCCARDANGRARAAEQRDELATLHSITSSARARTVAGRSRPSAFAVLRLMTSSYLEVLFNRQV